VKYGGVAPAEALKFVTLNPAKQLRIESRVGSVEVGKDADLVVWSGDPLAITSRVEQTWIDGRRYFDREDDLQARHRDASVRNRLVQKILDSGEEMASAEDREADESELWPREDIFCHGHGHGHGHEHAE
jgi:N-acetylglucosamine-6-phosphate deacetylase